MVSVLVIIIVTAGVGLPPHLIAVSLCIFVAASVSSTVGFAFSPIAGVMIFALVPNHGTVIMILLVASITLQSYAVGSLRNEIDVRRLMPVLAGGLAGLLPGVWLALNTSTSLLIAIVGLITIAYGAYVVAAIPLPRSRQSWIVDVAVGALGGITGPIAAFPGLAIAIWCQMQSLDKVAQRALFQPYILLMQVGSLVALGWARPQSLSVPEIAACSVPALAGAYLGLRCFRQLTTPQFNTLVGAFMLIAGTWLLFRPS